MIRRVLGVFFFMLCFMAGFVYAKDWYSILFIDMPSVVTIDGFLTTWAIIGTLLFGGMMTVVFLTATLEWIDKKSYVVGILVAFILSPAISAGIQYELRKVTAGFVECKDLRQSSRRHSSKTYAITPLECQRLVSEREARRL